MSAARVVAANESRSDITGPASSEHGSLDSSSGAPQSANASSRTQLPDVCPSARGFQRDEASYAPYVHVRTGERVQVPISIDPQTGRRELLVPHPENFVLPAYVREDEPRLSLPTLLRKCLGFKETTVEPPPHTPMSAPVHRQARIGSAAMRLDFGGDQDDPDPKPVAALSSTQAAILSKSLANMRTKLPLEDIPDFLIDFKAKLGGADPEARELLYASDWRSIMAAQSLEQANMRLATAIDATLDPSGDNVIILKSNLREAARTTCPGILFSGMDIIEAIEALLHGRSIGEIKLDGESGANIKFAAGAAITATRLTAEMLKKHHQLQPAAARSMPNALLHYMIEKMPTQPERLLLKKEEYENALYKSEMRGAPPPWSLKELIGDIAVDLARAGPKEASVVAVLPKPPELKPRPELTPSYICANCGAKGEHLNFDCPIKCGDCGLNFCSGARHAACAVAFDIPPSKRDPPLTNFHGKPLHQYLLGKLDAAWKLKHPGKEVSSLEVELESASPVLDSDDEPVGEAELIGLCNPCA